MSVPAQLATMEDEALRLLEEVAAADEVASAEVKARLGEHLARVRQGRERLWERSTVDG